MTKTCYSALMTTSLNSNKGVVITGQNGRPSQGRTTACRCFINDQAHSQNTVIRSHIAPLTKTIHHLTHFRHVEPSKGHVDLYVGIPHLEDGNVSFLDGPQLLYLGLKSQ